MIPCVDLLNIIREGFQFLRGVVTDLQLNNLMMIATTVILYSRFNLKEAMNAYARMIRQSYDLQGEGGVIKFPICWRIYFKGGKKTKNGLALELIREGIKRGEVGKGRSGIGKFRLLPT
ncbi:hypothetical protein ES703_115638 [subsurface metagenome]